MALKKKTDDGVEPIFIFFVGVIAIIIATSGYLIGSYHGFHRGYGLKEQEEAETKKYVDEQMRDLGVCEWAKVMEKRHECRINDRKE